VKKVIPPLLGIGGGKKRLSLGGWMWKGERKKYGASGRKNTRRVEE